MRAQNSFITTKNHSYLVLDGKVLVLALILALTLVLVLFIKLNIIIQFYILLSPYCNLIVTYCNLIKTNMAFIMSTRFSNETYEQNRLYRELNGIQEYIYCQRIQIKSQIPLNTLLYLVEMNNSTNQILGIGLIKNFIVTDKCHKVYSSNDLNRYIYKTNYRLDREELLSNPSLLVALETICFKGKTHLKRIPGISVIPDKLLFQPHFKHINFKLEISHLFSLKYGRPSASA